MISFEKHFKLESGLWHTVSTNEMCPLAQSLFILHFVWSSFIETIFDCGSTIRGTNAKER